MRGMSGARAGFERRRESTASSRHGPGCKSRRPSIARDVARDRVAKSCSRSRWPTVIVGIRAAEAIAGHEPAERELIKACTSAWPCRVASAITCRHLRLRRHLLRRRHRRHLRLRRQRRRHHYPRPSPHRHRRLHQHPRHWLHPHQPQLMGRARLATANATAIESSSARVSAAGSAAVSAVAFAAAPAAWSAAVPAHASAAEPVPGCSSEHPLSSPSWRRRRRSASSSVCFSCPTFPSNPIHTTSPARRDR